MIEWKHLTSAEIEHVDKRLPVILPVGLIEAHGLHLALSVDADTAEYFARRIAEESGAILAPLWVYGFADELSEYPGTIGLTIDTAIAVMTDLVCHFCRGGFKRVIVLSGHAGNKTAFDAAIYRIWARHPDAKVVCWNYWSEAGFTNLTHAGKGETEIAMAVGTRAPMDRVKDCVVKKPWYRVRSRHSVHPETGGVNGAPSQADPAEGTRMRDEIVQILAAKVRAIIAEEASN